MERGTPRVPFMLEFDYIEDESDEDRRGQDSSEDELDIILHGTPEQKRKLTRSLSRGSLELSSSEDEFEKEMEKELNETMRLHEEQYSKPKDEASTSSSQRDSFAPVSTAQPEGSSLQGQQNDQQKSSLAQQFYDDIYFDSDSDSADEGEQKKKQTRDKKQKLKHRVMTNDELLYDPNADDEDQKWVDRQRQKYRNQQKRKTPPKHPVGTDANNVDIPDTVGDTDDGVPSSSAPALPKSDAVLNCPACLTTLCLDCQRHELYHNQFRAMFVLNCSIIRSEKLKYPVPKKNKRWKKNKGKRRGEEAGEGSSSREKAGEDGTEELYFPVKCSVCNTEVGVYDEDEVFHFFNVLPSNA